MSQFAEIPAISIGEAVAFIGAQLTAAMLAGFRIANMTAQPSLLMAGAILVLFLDMDAMFYLWSHRKSQADTEAPALWLANFTITPGLAMGLVPFALEFLSSFKS